MEEELAINFGDYLYKVYPHDPIGSKPAIMTSKLRKWSKNFDEEVQRTLSPLIPENLHKPLTPEIFEDNGKPSSPVLFEESRFEENHNSLVDICRSYTDKITDYFKKMSGNSLTPEPENFEDDH